MILFPNKVQRKYLKQMGCSRFPQFLDVTNLETHHAHAQAQHPEESDQEAMARAIARLAWKQKGHRRLFVYVVVVIALLLIASKAHAQRGLDGVQVQDSTGTPLRSWFGGIAKLKCSTNLTCASSSGVVSVSLFSSIRLAEQFSGTDCSDKINAADADLGTNSGEIWVTANCTPLTLNTIVVISANHILRFRAGAGTFTNTQTSASLGHIRLKNNSAMICDDWNTIIQESSFNGSRATIVQAFTTGHNSQANDITISGCHFQGANPIANSAPGTIELANCLRCKFTNNWLESTRDNGIISGGGSGTTFADDNWITENLFTNVVAQAASVVNGKNVHISRNTFRSPGLNIGGIDKIGTQVDVETNVSTDLAENIEITDNVFDFRDSPVAEATGAWGIYFQHTPSSTNSGPVNISGNLFIGGVIAQDGTATHHMITAIACNGQPAGTGRDCVITNNTIINPLQAPITVSDANRALVMGNKILCNSDGVNGAILLKDATNSEVIDNVMEGDGTCTQGTNKQKVVEQGTSDNNLFVDNIGTGVVILGANTLHRSIDHSGNVTGNMKETFSAGIVLDNIAAPTVAASQIGFGSTTATTVGAAGAAAALPANPTGYIIVNVAGTNFKIPYYAN